MSLLRKDLESSGKEEKNNNFSFKYTKGKYLVFRGCVLADGMGDLGHFLDLSKPEILHKLSQNLGITIDNSPTADCKPYYILAHEKQVRQIVRRSLEESKIQTSLGSPIRILEFKEDGCNDPRFHPKDTLPPGGSDVTCGIIDISVPLNDGRQETCIFNTCCRTQIEEHGPAIQIPSDLEKDYFYDRCRFVGGISNRSLGKQLDTGFHLLLSTPTAETLEQKASILLKMHHRPFVDNLLEKEEVKIDDVATAKKFLENNLFVPAYFQCEIYMMSFVEGIVTSDIAKLKNYSNIIFYSNKLIDSFDEELLAKHGFSGVELQSPEGKRVLLGSREGKRIRIMHHYPLNDEDYHSLFSIAQFYGACSGDKTLELCLSNHLIFFSEVRGRKVAFYEYLIGTMRLYTKNENILEYLSLIKESLLDITRMHRMLTLSVTDNFNRDWKEMCNEFISHHNYYDIYADVVRKNLMIHELLSAVNVDDFKHVDNVLKHFTIDEIQNVVELVNSNGGEIADYVLAASSKILVETVSSVGADNDSKNDNILSLIGSCLFSKNVLKSALKTIKVNAQSELSESKLSENKKSP